MTILRVEGFRIKPGRHAEALSIAGELKGRIKALGGGRSRLMYIEYGGESSGQYYGEIEFENMSGYGAYATAAGADAATGELMGALFAPDGPAHGQSSMLVSVIETFGSRTHGYEGGVEILRDVEVVPGRMDEVRQIVADMNRYTGPLGAYVRSIRVAVGGRPGGYTTVAEYPDMAALATFMEQVVTNPEMRAIARRTEGPDAPGVSRSISIHREVVL